MSVPAKLQVLRALLRPSLFSFLFTLVLAAGLLVASSWSYVIRSPLFFEYFFGPDGLVTVLQNSPDSLSAFGEAVLAGPWTYNVLVLIVAVIVGLTVYVFLEGFDRLADTVRRLLPGAREAGEVDKETQIETGVRLSVRIATFFLWVVYLVSFSKILLPFSILVFRDGAQQPFTQLGTQNTLIGIGVLFLALHLHVVLLRLLTLRLRIFGAPPEEAYLN